MTHNFHKTQLISNGYKKYFVKTQIFFSGPTLCYHFQTQVQASAAHYPTYMTYCSPFSFLTDHPWY